MLTQYETGVKALAAFTRDPVAGVDAERVGPALTAARQRPTRWAHG
jgi:hypothetical protein